ncbi:acyltransferase family protein [Rodentibacter ratti]|uniref:Acyltransferase n=1 Tax=Rodentibacter ratti TaxID=1906745 RepID=A0A1V3L9R4_9PAST|nr:acyltransferase [Rodentibacter ratti]OOF86123.1 acyltransferase [Rodentibacter ratti]
MKSLNTNYFSRIDHLRFFAATLVIFHHFKGNLSLENVVEPINYFFTTWLINGSTGVSLFLFLTGFLFCIISGYGEKKINYKGFVYNRILRIFPLMILMVFIVITVNRAESTPMDIFRILTLQLNTGQSYTGWGHDFYPSGPIWTIAVEFQFYLLFPFLSLFLSKYGCKYLIAVVILIIGLRYNVTIATGKQLYWNFYHTILGRLDQFIVGMIFAILWKRGGAEFFSSRISSLIAIVFSISILTYLFTFKKTEPIYLYYSFTIEAICWGLIVMAYLSVKLPDIKAIDISLAKLGEISFSLYILHLPLGHMFSKVLSLPVATNIIDSLYYSTIKFIPIIIISFFTYHVIEKPFMSMRVKYT